MSTYLEQKIEEALKEANGNHLRAAAFLQRMAENDEVLYAGLTNPFLSSAATFAIQRFLSQQRGPSSSAKKASSITDGDLDKLVNNMANNGDNDFIGSGTPAGKAAQGSSRHSSNMQKIAEAFGGPAKPDSKSGS